MTQFQWKDRKKFIQKCSARAINDFFSIQNHLQEIGVAPEKFDLDLDGIIDNFISDYSYNPGWMGKTADKKIKIDLVKEIYEYGRLLKGKMGGELLQNWAKVKFEELK